MLPPSLPRRHARLPVIDFDVREVFAGSSAFALLLSRGYASQLDWHPHGGSLMLFFSLPRHLPIGTLIDESGRGAKIGYIDAGRAQLANAPNTREKHSPRACRSSLGNLARRAISPARFQTAGKARPRIYCSPSRDFRARMFLASSREVSTRPHSQVAD